VTRGHTRFAAMLLCLPRKRDSVERVTVAGGPWTSFFPIKSEPPLAKGEDSGGGSKEEKC
jgi:hypothetical protein